MQSITTQNWKTAKRAVKNVGVLDYSLAHRVAIEKLTELCPNANIELITDMAWEIVKSVRNG